jgi:hypothetical protein
VVVEEARGEAQCELTRAMFDARLEMLLLVEPDSQQIEHVGVHGDALSACRLSKLLSNV